MGRTFTRAHSNIIESEQRSSFLFLKHNLIDPRFASVGLCARFFLKHNLIDPRFAPVGLCARFFLKHNLIDPRFAPVGLCARFFLKHNLIDPRFAPVGLCARFFLKHNLIDPRFAPVGLCSSGGFSFGACRRLILAFFCLWICLGQPSDGIAKPDISRLKPHNIDVLASAVRFDPKQPKQLMFGQLQWRGGLVLTSPSSYFGGFSGLAIEADGKQLFAVSDAGVWMAADLEYDGRDLAGVGKVRVGPLVDLGGQPLMRRGDYDAESVAVEGAGFSKGTIWVAFEQRHRILPFRMTKSGLARVKGRIRVPPSFGPLSANKGLEAISFLPSDRSGRHLAVFAERFKDRRGDLKGLQITTKAKKSLVRPLTLKRLNGFDVTGLAPLTGGDLAVLERRFRRDEGVKMRIRRIAGQALKANKLISGDVLLQADQRYTIDNMEGIATHRSKKGEQIITLISDDNFNFFQRTLILQFALTRSKPDAEVETNLPKKSQVKKSRAEKKSKDN